MNKVAILIPSLSGGGAEHAAVRIAESIKDTYDCTIIVFDGERKDYEYSGKIISLNIESQHSIILKFMNILKRILKLYRIKKTDGFDLVISFMDVPNVVNILSKVRGCKTIVSIRNYSFLEKNENIISKILFHTSMLLYHKADSIWVVSNEIKKEMLKVTSLSSKKIKVVYNPYDFNKINCLSHEKTDKTMHDFIQNKTCICSVGRISYQKGYWHLIKAFKICVDHNPNLVLLIVGRDESNGKLIKLIEDLGLSDKVRLLGFQNNPYKYMSLASVYVLSSLFEGFPNSLVEAMSLKIPAVAVNCKSGPKEILSYDKETDIDKYIFTEFGILVNEMDFDEDYTTTISEKEINLAYAILEILLQANIEKYAKASFKRAMEFDNSKFPIKFNNLINEMES